MNLPQVSFIIPYYNAGATIQETVDSIFNQTYPNFDIWLINDGRTDPYSLEQQKQFVGNEKIHILDQENTGPSILRNKTIIDSSDIIFSCNNCLSLNFFFMDRNDVFIIQNPLPFITIEAALYVGTDNANRIKDSGWLKDERLMFLEESKYSFAKSYEYQWVYNAGVTGGSYRVMLFLTREIAKLIFKATSNHHKDMTLLNIIIHEHFFPFLSKYNWEQQLVDPKNDAFTSHSQLITGYPFNSGFKDFDSTAYFIHK